MFLGTCFGFVPSVPLIVKLTVMNLKVSSLFCSSCKDHEMEFDSVEVHEEKLIEYNIF